MSDGRKRSIDEVNANSNPETSSPGFSTLADFNFVMDSPENLFDIRNLLLTQRLKTYNANESVFFERLIYKIKETYPSLIQDNSLNGPGM